MSYTIVHKNLVNLFAVLKNLLYICRMNIAEYTELKKRIETETGLTLSQKVAAFGTSMRGYVELRPRKVNGIYPTFPFALTTQLRADFPGQDPTPNFFSIGSISIYLGNEAYNLK